MTDIISEKDLCAFLSMDDDHAPLGGVVDTHDGQLRREGANFRWHQGEELAVPFRVEIKEPTP